MEFSAQIKYVRKLLGVTQRELASMIGVDLSTINRWENRQSRSNYAAITLFVEFCEKRGIEIPANADK